ncbi:MAG: YncE family protein [Planctomycetota bacterium]
MTNNRLSLVLLGSLTAGLGACGSGGSESTNSTMDLVQVSNGFGQVLPHQVLKVGDNGQITNTVISIRTLDDFLRNVNSFNPVRAPILFPPTATLPTNAPGNQFFFAEFSQDIDIDSVLDAAPGSQANSGLLGSITLVAVNPSTGTSSSVPCRVLINGFTYAGSPDPGTGLLPLQRWVELDVNGAPQLAADGLFAGIGFPGTPGFEFSGGSQLVSPRTVVLVADADQNLATLERFPTGSQLRLRITTGVKSTGGRALVRQALASTTVGPDNLKPEVALTPPPSNQPVVTPGQGDTQVDPLTNIRIEFTEPVQPLTLGSIDPSIVPILSAAVFVEFGPQAGKVRVPFTVQPVSVFDLSTYDLVPAFHFPGQGPVGLSCLDFNRIDVTVNPTQFRDLANNVNGFGATTFFITGEGQGLTNAPVTPDTVYIGRAGAVPGLSVVDLNGFGASTGDPTFDPNFQVFAEGFSNFPNNPNVRLQGSLVRPTLSAGTCTINGGSSGVFTLTRDSSLENLLVRAPDLTSVGDMMLGHALDSTFNNGPAPFGCQAGGGALCTLDGQKVITPQPNGNITGGGNSPSNTLVPVPLSAGGFGNGAAGFGAENLMNWAPHPNPPPLVFPPICISPYIGGQEPTSIDTITTVAGGVFGGTGLANLLVPGDPFGTPTAANPQPPNGLLTPEQNGFFVGPSVGQSTIGNCLPYMIRQQIGHYLYVIDRGRREVVVLNSNRMTVVDRIPTPDPTTLAMSPNLDLLAVVNQIGNLVSFIDIDPNSSTFHQIVQETVVGNRPRGIAWDPGNEDVLVCNEADSTMSVISASSGTVRRVIASQLNEPFDLAITPRQQCWGYSRNVYFAYILNRNGRVAVFESGPNNVNGWGFDDIIGIAPTTFRNPKAIQADQVDLRSAVWIAHEGPIDLLNDQSGPAGVPAISKLVIESALSGALLLNTQGTNPQFRDMAVAVQVSIGANALSGLPADIAFDNMRSVSGLPNFSSQFSASAPVPLNGKHMLRGACQIVQNNSEPRFMFVAIPNPLQGSGVVDVIRVDGGFDRVDTNPFVAGVQSIQAPNVQVVMDYFRQ